MTRKYARCSRSFRPAVALLASVWLLPAQAQLPALVLNNPAPQPGAAFGQAVAIVGDVDGDAKADVLVGAPGQQVAGKTAQGQAFLFRGADSHLILTLNDPTPQDGAGFGSAVAAPGDVDGDGYPDLLVGASGQRVAAGAGSNQNGQAFVFSGKDGHLLYTVNSPVIVGFPGFGTFGAFAAGIGDVDGDGRPDFAVGWIGGRRGLGISLRPHAAVFSGIDGHLIHDFPGFGPQVSGAGDADGDGTPDVLIGTPRLPPQSLAATRADVFSGATGLAWLTVTDPVAPPPGAGGWGDAVAGVGDVDGDGRADLLVGASASQAFLFSGKDGQLQHTFTDPIPPSDGSGFGAVVGRPGDVDGDGVPDLAVSALAQERAFIFSGKNNQLLRTLRDPGGPSGGFGASVSGGDVNGDGLSDPVIGAPTAGGSGEGEAFVFPSPAPVSISLQPRSINPRANGVITVILPSTPTVNARLVIPASVRFGPAEAPLVSSNNATANGNGPGKLVMHFRVQDTGIACGDTQATLTGMTSTGVYIQGSASVTTAQCP